MGSTIPRWRAFALSLPLMMIVMSLAQAVESVPWRTVGAVLIAVGIVAAAYPLRHARGARLSDWGAAPATVDQVRGVCGGAAACMLGMAFIAASVGNLGGAPWDVVVLVAAFTLLPVYGAVMFLHVRSLAQEAPH